MLGLISNQIYRIYMVFASSTFFIFFAVVLSLYWLLPRFVSRSPILLIASWYFYAFGCWSYILLLLFFTAFDFFMAQKISQMLHEEKPTKAKILAVVSISLNVLILSGFKLSWMVNIFSDQILMPVGISFYTFQSIAYIVDIFRKKIPAQRNFVNYALYISFFPQLLAGPIERAGSILPILAKPWDERKPSILEIKEALWLIFWGLLKKVAIADRVRPFAAWAITGLGAKGAGDIWFASIVFILQFLADFSAYTDLARGQALLFGIRLSENFRYPYFSTSPKEFWQRWHITLGAWFRDYVYGPLVRHGVSRWAALLITMVLVGLWHGAKPKFVVWGAFWGFLIVLDNFLSPFLPIFHSEFLRKWQKILGWSAVMSAWILSGFFFVARDVQDASTLLVRAFTFFVSSRTKGDLVIAFTYLIPFIFVETMQWLNKDRFFWFRWKKPKQSIFLLVLVLFYLGNYANQGTDFIYFAF